MHSFLSLGRLQIPVFGLFAAAGLISAMALGLRTARMAGIDRDAFWDTGMVAVFSAFLLSRGLLVGLHIRTFLAYPAMLLLVPSLNLWGLSAAAVVTFAYLRHRRLRLLGALDALAPCAALLAAVLELGWVANGTREGMPTGAPWAVASAFGRVHPVELYSAIAWLVLCAGLLWALAHAQSPGETGAWGLVLGGLVLFATDFFRLPSALDGDAWLDPIQWRAVALMAAGCVMLVSRATAGRASIAAAAAAKEAGDAV